MTSGTRIVVVKTTCHIEEEQSAQVGKSGIQLPVESFLHARVYPPRESRLPKNISQMPVETLVFGILCCSWGDEAKCEKYNNSRQQRA